MAQLSLLWMIWFVPLVSLPTTLSLSIYSRIYRRVVVDTSHHNHLVILDLLNKCFYMWGLVILILNKFSRWFSYKQKLENQYTIPYWPGLCSVSPICSLISYFRVFKCAVLSIWNVEFFHFILRLISNYVQLLICTLLS